MFPDLAIGENCPVPKSVKFHSPAPPAELTPTQRHFQSCKSDVGFITRGEVCHRSSLPSKVLRTTITRPQNPRVSYIFSANGGLGTALPTGEIRGRARCPNRASWANRRSANAEPKARRDASVVGLPWRIRSKNRHASDATYKNCEFPQKYCRPCDLTWRNSDLLNVPLTTAAVIDRRYNRIAIPAGNERSGQGLQPSTGVFSTAGFRLNRSLGRGNG